MVAVSEAVERAEAAPAANTQRAGRVAAFDVYVIAGMQCPQ